MQLISELSGLSARGGILFAWPEFASEPFARRHFHRMISVFRLHTVNVGV